MRPWPWQCNPYRLSIFIHPPSASTPLLPPSRAFSPCSWPDPSIHPTTLPTVRHCHCQRSRSVILAQGRAEQPRLRRNKPMFSPEHRSPSLSTRTESPYRRCHITVRRSPSEFGMPIDIKALGAAPVSLPLFAGSSQEVSPHSHSRRPRARAGAMRANLVPGQSMQCKNSTTKQPTTLRNRKQ